MKKWSFLIPILAMSQQCLALHIVNASLWSISPQSLNVSVNTEAVELYYFQCWQYSISNNIIHLDACFVAGFGSAINALNNNFEVPIDTFQSTDYTIVISVYYTNLDVFYDPETLQDQISGTFTMPFDDHLTLGSYSSEQKNLSYDFYPNPTDGKLMFSTSIKSVRVFDCSGRLVAEKDKIFGIIDLANLNNGIYYVRYFKRDKFKAARIILNK